MIRIIISAIIPIAIGMLLSNIYKSNGECLINNLSKDHIVIRMPKSYIWIGIIDISFFGTCLVSMSCCSNGTEQPWVYLVFFLFVLFGVIIVWVALIWKIEIFRNEEYFLLKTAILKTYKIQYSDCIIYKFVNNSLVLKTNKKTFHVDCIATNFEFFVAMLNQHKVKQIHK